MPINFSHPTVWGPLVWNVLHLLASQFKASNVQDKQEWVNVLNSLPGILPCKECKEHFREYLKNNPVDQSTVNDAYSLSLYLWRAHEHVNGLTGKKSRVTFAMLCKQLNVSATPSPPTTPTETPSSQSQPQSQPIVTASSKSIAQIVEIVDPIPQRIEPTEGIRMRVTTNRPAQLGRSGSGKPSIRVPVFNNPEVQPTSPPSTEVTPTQPQPQRPQRQPPKAVPLAVQKMLRAQKNLADQINAHNTRNHVKAPTLAKPLPGVHASAPSSRPASTSTAIVKYKHQNPVQTTPPPATVNSQARKSLASIMNNSRKMTAPKPTVSPPVMKPIVPTPQQQSTLNKMAELLSKTGVTIRGIVTNVPKPIQTQLAPSVLNRMMNQTTTKSTQTTSRALALPAPKGITVPRGLNQSLPARKKCNCGRK